MDLSGLDISDDNEDDGGGGGSGGSGGSGGGGDGSGGSGDSGGGPCSDGGCAGGNNDGFGGEDPGGIYGLGAGASHAGFGTQSTFQSDGQLIEFLGKVLGGVWNIPNDVIGLVGGFAEATTGLLEGNSVHIGFGNGALQISGGGIGNGGITFGNIQLYNGYGPTASGGQVQITPQYTMLGSPYTTLSGYAIGSHEGVHTVQEGYFGPTFFPIYLGAAAIYGWQNNPFEKSADFGAIGGGPFSGFR